MRISVYEQFADLIVSGRKRHTIRSKPLVAKGDTIDIHISGNPVDIILHTVCTKVVPIEIDTKSIYSERTTMFFGGAAAAEFVADEGFRNVDEMLAFFRKIYEIPFKGYDIHWQYPGTVKPCKK